MRRLVWIFCLLLIGCQKSPPAQSAHPVRLPVEAGVAEKKACPLFIEALGHVEPIVSVELRSRIEGELIGVYFREGQEVKQGDLLFAIDPRIYEASLKAAKATLEQNSASMALAEEKVKRYRLLARDEFYSQIDYETLQAQLASSQALVEQNQAEVERAEIDLSYCRIYAPTDGMMGFLKIDQGNLVSADGDHPLAILNQMAPIYVTFAIPEVRLPEILSDKNRQVLAAYDDFAKGSFSGVLHTIDNRVDPKTGMIRLRAQFENTQRELWPGQFVRARLILATIDAVVIPYSAVLLTPKGPIAYVIRENRTVEQRPLKLGQREQEQVIVLEGLQAGERVVTEGILNLSPGASVFIQGEGTP